MFWVYVSQHTVPSEKIVLNYLMLNYFLPQSLSTAPVNVRELLVF